MISLWQSRELKSPKDTLSSMSEQCEELGINNFDVYGDFGLKSEQSWLRKFESNVVEYLGAKDAVFMPSGVMAQEIALSIHNCNNSETEKYFMCHYTSHLLLHEQGGYDKLLHMKPIIVQPVEGALIQPPMTYNSVMETFKLHPTITVSALFLECPHREIGGKCTPFEDILKLSEYCRANNIKVCLLITVYANIYRMIYICV